MKTPEKPTIDKLIFAADNFSLRKTVANKNTKKIFVKLIVEACAKVINFRALYPKNIANVPQTALRI